MFKNIKRNLKEWESTTLGAIIAGVSAYLYFTKAIEVSEFITALTTAAAFLGLSIKNVAK